MQIPLESTARHSSSLFCIGKDMFLELEELNRLPRKGIVGIDFIIVARVNGRRAL